MCTRSYALFDRPAHCATAPRHPGFEPAVERGMGVFNRSGTPSFRTELPLFLDSVYRIYRISDNCTSGARSAAAHQREIRREIISPGAMPKSARPLSLRPSRAAAPTTHRRERGNWSAEIASSLARQNKSSIHSLHSCSLYFRKRNSQFPGNSYQTRCAARGKCLLSDLSPT